MVSKETEPRLTAGTESLEHMAAADQHRRDSRENGMATTDSQGKNRITPSHFTQK